MKIDSLHLPTLATSEKGRLFSPGHAKWEENGKEMETVTKDSLGRFHAVKPLPWARKTRLKRRKGSC